ncbi:MAG: DNA processing protein DprA [Flavobacterium sp. BFFFF2]|nr:MAG: DNA processing protein DprA [Flavobacterium sp. BFFFF2]
MALTTEQNITILKLKGLGRRTAFKINQDMPSNIRLEDGEVLDYINKLSIEKKVQRLGQYTAVDYQKAQNEVIELLMKSENAGVKALSFYDNKYPKSLKTIEDPPLIIYYSGNINKLNDTDGIAIIGTREPSEAGFKAGEYFGEKLGKTGYNIVSGLAIGCDASAHKGALKASGFTTAILAHGMQTIYPKENKLLAEEILNNDGILLTEYIWGTGALPNYFVERDRLQAGLSKGTIVIQTDVQGGTMHAVNATIKSNKPLAAVKYVADTELNNPKIKGNEMLINEGKAFPLTSKNLDEFILRITKLPTNKNVISDTNRPIGDLFSEESSNI